MTNENAQVTAWTIVGVAVCAAFAFMIHGCVDMVKSSDQVELQKHGFLTGGIFVKVRV